MTIENVRRTIADARRLELLTGSFEFSLQNKKRRLHRAIQLPSQRSSGALVDFVTRYIEQTVILIESMEQRARDLGLAEAVRPAISTAIAFFRVPPLPSRQTIPEGEPRLRMLMEQAYLAQRLLEEENDLFALWRDARLITFEITQVNLIIHQLIGEPRANQLDVIAYQIALEHLPMIRQTEPVENHQPHHPLSVGDRYPLPLIRSDSSIRLIIGSSNKHSA